MENSADDTVSNENRKKEIYKTRLLLTLPLFLVLIILVSVTLLLYFVGLRSIAVDIPLFIVMGGIVVLFIGSFYDFGAKNYIERVFVSKAALKERDVVSINREQLIMNGIFAAVGGIFILSGIGLFFLFNFLK